MRPETVLILSEYVFGHIALGRVREYVDDVDWDDRLLGQDERALLLKVEAYLVGIDDGLNDEADLKEMVLQSKSIQVQWILLSDRTPVCIFAGTTNRPQEASPSIDVSSLAFAQPAQY